jgi:hypothetical protein
MIMPKANDDLQRDRVRRQTSAPVQDTIDEKTTRNIRYFAAQPRAALDHRIAELEREWDVERVLETNASVLALTGAVLGTTVDKRWFIVTGVVLGFLTQHAITGWCPPLPVFRRLGIRTRTEIDQERYALKALRGDFQAVRRGDGAAAVQTFMQAVEA